jgi:hypothetical protein
MASFAIEAPEHIEGRQGPVYRISRHFRPPAGSSPRCSGPSARHRLPTDSRQEEAQRLGRVLRPKADGRQAHFYTVVSRGTIDTEYAAHRPRFLAEQGYAYTIVDADDVLGPKLPTVD